MVKLPNSLYVFYIHSHGVFNAKRSDVPYSVDMLIVAIRGGNP